MRITALTPYTPGIGLSSPAQMGNKLTANALPAIALAAASWLPGAAAVALDDCLKGCDEHARMGAAAPLVLACQILCHLFSDGAVSPMGPPGGDRIRPL